MIWLGWLSHNYHCCTFPLNIRAYFNDTLYQSCILTVTVPNPPSLIRFCTQPRGLGLINVPNGFYSLLNTVHVWQPFSNPGSPPFCAQVRTKGGGGSSKRVNHSLPPSLPPSFTPFLPSWGGGVFLWPYSTIFSGRTCLGGLLFFQKKSLQPLPWHMSGYVPAIPLPSPRHFGPYGPFYSRSFLTPRLQRTRLQRTTIPWKQTALWHIPESSCNTRALRSRYLSSLHGILILRDCRISQGASKYKFQMGIIRHGSAVNWILVRWCEQFIASTWNM